MPGTVDNEIAIKRVKTILAKHKSLSPPELIQLMEEGGIAKSEARRVAWHMLDRGEIVVDRQMHFTLQTKKKGDD
ncbi:MAG: hypothetical protein HYU30_01240 [Chloroflexi bacterium]|nr:hypothetical protein [Chloroflexota bacterium]